VSEYDTTGFVNEIFIKVFRMDLAGNRGSCTGIFPLNGNIFDDIDFLP
jgi:hypothetical protein